MAAPTLNESITQVRNDLAAEGVSQVWLRRTFESALATVVGSLLWAWYRWIDAIRLQTNPLTATGTFLRLWGAIWGLTPNVSATAAGSVLLAGNEGAVQPAGSIIIGPDAQEYTTDAGATIPAEGVVFVNVTARAAGDVYNLDPSTPVIVASPASGITGTAQVWLINGGRTAEDDEAFRTRILDRIQKPANVGNVDDYTRWAKEASASVSRVFVYRCGRTGSTAGTVLTLFAVGGTNPIPSGGTVTTVSNYILARSPVGSKPTTQAPTGQAVAMTVALDPTRNNATTQALVLGHLRAQFGLTTPGGSMTNLDVRAALARAGISYQLQSLNGDGTGASDVTATSNLHLLYLGTVTWGTWA